MENVVDEFSELILPDARLVRRVQSFVAAASGMPSASLPQMLQDAAGLEGGYRLLNNWRGTFESLQSSPRAQAAKRAVEAGDVVVVHDTTDIETPYAEPEEVGYLN